MDWEILKGRRGRWLAGAAAGIVLYALAGFLLAPWLVERALLGTLTERLALQTSVADVRINPFALSLTVDGFQATEPDDTPLLHFERLFVNFQVASLFRFAWSFDELHLIRPKLLFERRGETETNFAQLAEVWLRTAEPESTSGPAPENESELVRIRVADFRIVEGHFTLADQTQREPFSTDFTPIDLVITNLSTLPETSGAQEVLIRAESGAEIGWTGSLSVNPLAVSGSVRLQGTYTPMLFRYFQDELALPVTFGGGEIDAAFDYRVWLNEAGELLAEIENVSSSLTGLSVGQPDYPELVQIGTLQLTNGSLAWPERRVHLDDVRFDGVRIDAYQRDDGRYLPALEADSGTTSEVPPEDRAEAAAGIVSETPWSITVDHLRFSRWQLRHTDTRIEATLGIETLNLTLTGISNTDGQQMELSMDLVPELGGRVDLNGTLVLLPAPTLSAEIQAEGLALAAGQPYLNTVANIGIVSGLAALRGRLDSSEADPIRYEGSFDLADLELIDRAQEELLFSLQALNVDHLAATADALALSSLSIEAPYLRLEIEEDGSTNIARTLLADSEDATPNGTDATTDEGSAERSSRSFRLTVDETRVTNATAHYTDLALPLPFDASISKLDGTLSGADSASRTAARLAMEGQVNEHGRLEIAGSLQPFAPLAGTDVRVAFENVDLPRMSPYTIKFAGRRIDDGRTDLTLTYQVTDGRLEGDNRLQIYDLELGEKVEHPNAMDLPLDLAVALLKDPSGKVDFDFPVSGSLDNPEFSFSGAVMKAFSNVIFGLATAPFRLLGNLVGVEPSEFESIAFVAGRADLTPPQRETLQRLVEALSQRPKLTLALTPVAAPTADRQALKAAQVDAEVASRLAEEKDSKALIGERRLEQLESLYDEAGLETERATLKAQATTTDDAGAATFDALAYAESLRTALIDARQVSDEELTALAEQRVQAVRELLTEENQLQPERLKLLPGVRVEADAGAVRMPLEVSVSKGRSS